MPNLNPDLQVGGRLGPDQKLYFNHISKTAGTTLYSILDLHFASHEILPASTFPQLLAVREEKRTGYRLYRGHFGWMLPEILGISCVGMTMLREPIRRALSNFEHGQRAQEMFPGLPLDEFFEDRQGFRDFFEDHHVRNLMPLEIFRALPPDERVGLAWKNLESLSFFGIVERFEESMMLLAHTFGWPLATGAQRLNVTPEASRIKRPSEEIRPDILARIEELNRGDVSLYARANALFDRRIHAMQRELLEEVSLDRYRRGPITFPYRLSLSQAVPGTGWHGHEDLEGKYGVAFRWTGPGTESTLHLRLPTDRDVTFEMVIVNAIAEDVLDSLRLRVNGAPVPLIFAERSGTWARMQGTVPRRVLGNDSGLAVLTFCTARTASPQELDPSNPDYRRLGVAVSEITLGKVAAGLPPSLAG
jgi:hypothetical protein